MEENLTRSEAKEMLLMAEEACGRQQPRGQLPLNQLRRFVSGRASLGEQSPAPPGTSPRPASSSQGGTPSARPSPERGATATPQRPVHRH